MHANNLLKMSLLTIITLFTVMVSTGCSLIYEWANDPSVDQKYNRGYRTVSTRIEDNASVGALKRSIAKSSLKFPTKEIKATSYNRVLLITGRVNTKQQKSAISKMAEKLPYVDKFFNEVEVRKLTDSIENYYPDDEWITTKIKTRMFFTEHFPSSKLKVVTYNHTVYLLGSLSKEDADKAVSIAKQIRGVHKIIKIIEPVNFINHQKNSRAHPVKLGIPVEDK